MATIRDGLTWSGSGATLSMFVITRSQEPPSLELSDAISQPKRVRTYRLDDVAGTLGGRSPGERFHTNPSEVPHEPERLGKAIRNVLDSSALQDPTGFQGEVLDSIPSRRAESYYAEGVFLSTRVEPFRAKLTPKRIKEIRSHLPEGGEKVPVKEGCVWNHYTEVTEDVGPSPLLKTSRL